MAPRDSCRISSRTRPMPPSSTTLLPARRRSLKRREPSSDPGRGGAVHGRSRRRGTQPLMNKHVLSRVILLVGAGAYYWATLQIPNSSLSDEVGAQGLPRILAFLLAGLAVL